MDNSETVNTAYDVALQHKTSYKTKQTEDWYIPIIDYYIDLGKNLNDKIKTQENLNNSNCIISDDIYKSVLSQINSKNFDTKVSEFDFLDELDIITPIKERYMGEFIKTPSFYTCTVEDENATLSLNEEVRKKVFAILMSKLQLRLEEIQSELIQQNKTPEEQQQALQSINIEDEISKIKQEFFSKEGAKAKKQVEFFVKETRLNENMYQLFLYYFSTLEAYLEIVPKRNKIAINIIKPTEYFRIPSNTSIFTEDDIAGYIRTKVHVKKILDDFDDELSSDDKAFLQELMSEGSSAMQKRVLNSYHASNSADINKDVYSTANEFESLYVNKLYFTTKRKVGTLTYIALNNEIEERIVGDTYKIDKENGDLKIDWSWEDEIWVGYRIGEDRGRGIYIPPKPIIIQRDELGEKNTTTIPIVGIDGYLKDVAKYPVCSRIASHQAFYILLSYKARTEIAKFHGYVNLIPESILNDSADFTQTQRLEYMYKDNLLLFDDSEVNVNILQAIRTIGNTGQAEYIKMIYEIRDAIKAEAWELANMNAERYGNIDVRGGVGNTQESIRRISTGSILLFTMFDMFRERVYQALSDYGRIVYIDGINSGYNLSDDDEEELNVSHEELLSKNIGIFFTTNVLEKEKMEQIRNAMIQTNIQSGNELGAIDTLKQNDLESLKIQAQKFQDAKNAREEMLAQREQEVRKYVEDKKFEMEQMKLASSEKEVDMKGQYDLLIKDKEIYMTALELQAQRENVLLGLDSNANGIIDSKNDENYLNEELAFMEKQIKFRENELKLAKQKQDKRK